MTKVEPHMIEGASHSQLRIAAPLEPIPADVIRATKWELPSIWGFIKRRYTAQDVREMKNAVLPPDVTEQEIYAVMHHAIPGHMRFTDESRNGQIIIVYFRNQPYTKNDGPYWEINVATRKMEVIGKYKDGVQVGLWIQFSPDGELRVQKFNDAGGLVFSKISNCNPSKQEEGKVTLTIFRPGATPLKQTPLLVATWPCQWFPSERFASITPYNQWGTNLIALWFNE